jgi:ubiquinone/menaquinone biosynthesis C-methylase UbiE
VTRLTTAQWDQRFRQQAGWTFSARHYLLEKAALGNEARILDIGCGTGAVLAELASEFPRSVGIDINQEYLLWFREQSPRVLLTGADGYQLPFPVNSFDLVCCHFLLLWLKDPAAVIDEAIRVCKPGGILLVLAEPDYGGRIDHPPALQVLGEAQTQSLIDQGADPYIGRKLAGIASSFSRLRDIEVGILGYQASLHDKNSFWEREWEILADDIRDRFPTEDLEDLKRVDQEARANGSRVLYVPTFYIQAKIAKEGSDEN